MSETDSITLEEIKEHEQPIVDDEQKKLDLPPYPEGLFELTEDEKKELAYSGDPKDITLRLRTKVLFVWLAWASLRTNEKLISLVNEAETTDQKQIFFLKQLLVSVVDRLGKVLGMTHITEELFKPKEPEPTEQSSGGRIEDAPEL